MIVLRENELLVIDDVGNRRDRFRPQSLDLLLPYREPPRAPFGDLAALDTPEECGMQLFTRSASTDRQNARHLMRLAIALLECTFVPARLRLPANVRPQRAVRQRVSTHDMS